MGFVGNDCADTKGAARASAISAAPASTRRRVVAMRERLDMVLPLAGRGVRLPVEVVGRDELGLVLAVGDGRVLGGIGSVLASRQARELPVEVGPEEERN